VREVSGSTCARARTIRDLRIALLALPPARRTICTIERQVHGLLSRCVVQPRVRRLGAGDTVALRASAFTRPAPFIITGHWPEIQRTVGSFPVRTPGCLRIGSEVCRLFAARPGIGCPTLPPSVRDRGSEHRVARRRLHRARRSRGRPSGHRNSGSRRRTLPGELPGGELPKEIPGGCRSRCCSGWRAR